MERAQAWESAAMTPPSVQSPLRQPQLPLLGCVLTTLACTPFPLMALHVLFRLLRILFSRLFLTSSAQLNYHLLLRKAFLGS